MPEFEYQILDNKGNKFRGVLLAEDLASAKSALKEKGGYILELKEKKANTPKLGTKFFSLSSEKIKDQDLYNTFKELAILIKAGLRIDKALEIIINTTPNQKLKKSLEEVLREIKIGNSIVQSFSKGEFLSPLVLSIISSGEAIGKIASAFENISDYYKFQIQFKNEIKNAMTYPLFLITASLVTLLVIFRFVIPRFFNLFANLTLPLPAKIIYFLSQKLFLFNWYSLIILIILFLYIRKIPLYKKIKQKTFFFFLKIPFFKRLLLLLDYSRFSYSMYSMLKAGVEFVDALYLSKNMVLSTDLKNFFEKAIGEIKKGRGLGEVFRESDLLPPVFYNMIKVGEESGNLKDIFWELYNMYDEAFRNKVKRLLTLIEPVIITVTGLFIGLIVISLILTVMSTSMIRF
ncbi:MAG: type II secretion system F family protein [Caldimicrobium sp.]